MSGVAVAVHQSSNRSDRRKLVSITRSPSVAVVSEIAPMWMTASSLRPSSQPRSSDGGTKSASWRLARFCHFLPGPSISETTTSARPASFNAATIFDPIKPAPPVTSNIDVPASICTASFAPPAPAKQSAFEGFGGAPLPAGGEQLPTRPNRTKTAPLNNELKFTIWWKNRGSGRHPADPDYPLYVDWRFRAGPYGRARAEWALAEP